MSASSIIILCSAISVLVLILTLCLLIYMESLRKLNFKADTILKDLYKRTSRIDELVKKTEDIKESLSDKKCVITSNPHKKYFHKTLDKEKPTI